MQIGKQANSQIGVKKYGSVEVWECGSGIYSHTPILPYFHTSTLLKVYLYSLVKQVVLQGLIGKVLQSK